MFSGTIHNIGNILTMASLAMNELEESYSPQSPPLLDMVLDEMLPTLQNQVAEGTAQQFLAEDPQGSEYLTAMHDLLDYQRKVLMQQRHAVESLSSKLSHINQIISLQQRLLVGIGSEETVSLDQILEDALKMVGSSATRHHVDIARRFEPAADIHGDASTLTQVVINLIKNAIEALDEVADHPGKRVMVSICSQKHDNQTWSCCIIADNGPGMSDEIRQNAFNFGYTTKNRTRGERGVGLNFCQRTVERHGGHIALDTEPGVGTTFTIRLPAAHNSEHD